MKKIVKVDDELLDDAGRAVAHRLTRLLESVPDDLAYLQPRRSNDTPQANRARPCSFCGGAGEVETEIEDYAGSMVVITIVCPHP